MQFDKKIENLKFYYFYKIEYKYISNIIRIKFYDFKC